MSHGWRTVLGRTITSQTASIIIGRVTNIGCFYVLRSIGFLLSATSAIFVSSPLPKFQTSNIESGTQAFKLYLRLQNWKITCMAMDCAGDAIPTSEILEGDERISGIRLRYAVFCHVCWKVMFEALHLIILSTQLSWRRLRLGHGPNDHTTSISADKASSCSSSSRIPDDNYYRPYSGYRTTTVCFPVLSLWPEYCDALALRACHRIHIVIFYYPERSMNGILYNSANLR